MRSGASPTRDGWEVGGRFEYVRWVARSGQPPWPPWAAGVRDARRMLVDAGLGQPRRLVRQHVRRGGNPVGRDAANPAELRSPPTAGGGPEGARAEGRQRAGAAAPHLARGAGCHCPGPRRGSGSRALYRRGAARPAGLEQQSGFAAATPVTRARRPDTSGRARGRGASRCPGAEPATRGDAAGRRTRAAAG